MSEELKPCPFCGTEPNFQEHPQFGARYFCDFGHDHSIFVGGDTPNDAAAAWNRRADSLAASHQRLKEALQSFVFEFGDKTNSATVNKAREALRSAP